MSGSIVTLVVVLALLLFVASVILRTIKIVPQQTAVIIERLGSYSRTLDDGMHVLVPFIDKPRATIDLREQVVTFPPQPVITSDNFTPLLVGYFPPSVTLHILPGKTGYF